MNFSMPGIAQKRKLHFSFPNKVVWIQPTLLFGGMFFCYAGLFVSLVQTWWNNDVYSHGFLIPFISLYLIWLRREDLRVLQPVPAYVIGFSVLLAGLLMLIAGNAGGILLLEEFSLIVTLIGIVLFLFGKVFMKVLWFPIVYLVFMMPSWGILIDRLHFPFQELSAILGTAMLHLLGVPAFQQSIFIELPKITLEVAKVCSGVSYLIAIIAMAVALASIALRSFLRRIFLIGGAIIISIFSNSLRIALIGAFSYYQLSESLHGPYHIFQGLLVSQIGFIVLFLGTWILSKSPAASDAAPRPRAYSLDAAVPRTTCLRGLRGYVLSISAMLLLTGLYIHFSHPKPVPLKKGLAGFPRSLGEWRGTDQVPAYHSFGEVDTSLSRTYRNSSGEERHLYIGYYERQSQGRELINYESAAFHLDALPVKMMLGEEQGFVVNRLVDRKRNQVIFFWYDLNGRTVTNRYLAKAYTAWNTLVRRSSNGAVVVISEKFTQGDSERVLRDEEGFIREVVSILPEYLPSRARAE